MMKAMRAIGATALAVAAAAAVAGPVGPAWAGPGGGTVLHADRAAAVADSYLVVFRDGAVGQAAVGSRAGDLAGRHGGTVKRTYQRAVRGFEARLSADAAKRIAADPAVRYVQQNQVFSVTGSQSPTPSWGLDRIDQRALPLDGSYSFGNGAANVRAYVVDTGIRLSHVEFWGRAVSGRDTLDNDNDAGDCHGHGTHVAGTLGGSSFGVAKRVTLVGVRVANCAGQATTASMVAGLDWVIGDHDPGEPAVANMSLGGGYSQAINDAVGNAIADGVTFAVAAGNSNADACTASPASTPGAITVGATQQTDARYASSNYGSCLDLFAPGASITSAWGTDDNATRTLSGSSMASPHVAGAAALILSANPALTPQQVRDRLVADAGSGAVLSPGAGSPNRLLRADPTATAMTCSGENPTDTPIPEWGIGKSAPVDVPLTIGGCPGTASAASTVEVHLQHPYIGQLWVSLLAPDGTEYELHDHSGNFGTAIDRTYTVNLEGRAANGTWRLRVHDTSPGHVGSVDRWALDLAVPSTCSRSNRTGMKITHPTPIDSVIDLSGCNRVAARATVVEVHILHPQLRDLEISLITPNGATHFLHRFTGVNDHNIDRMYTVMLFDEPAGGPWRLHIRDAWDSGIGYLISWAVVT